MRLHRFYVNKPLGEELVVESAGEEKKILHQWMNVFRYTSGDEVILFSGSIPDTDFLYIIQAISKKECILAPVSRNGNIRAYPVTLVMALVKKDTFEQIVRHATELGVSRIIPVMASRSEKKNLNFERLRAISIESSEQSGRGTVPEITDIVSLKEAHALNSSRKNIVGSLHGSKLLEGGSADSLCVWVGPEGGWTEEEEAFFKEHEFTVVKTVDTVMKADTAVVNLISVALSHFFHSN